MSDNKNTIEWHLANILGYIAMKPLYGLNGLHDNDTARMEVVIRVGDIRAAYRALIATGGTTDAEGKWLDSVDNACAHCGGSGHKDDAQ